MTFIGGRISRESCFAFVIQRPSHTLLKRQQPRFDRSLSLDRLGKRHIFSRRVNKPIDLMSGLLVLPEFNALDSIETLAHVGLHRMRVTSLGQNFQQLIVRQEIKARKRHAFGLEILFETLLNGVQGFVVHQKRIIEFLSIR